MQELLIFIAFSFNSSKQGIKAFNNSDGLNILC